MEDDICRLCHQSNVGLFAERTFKWGQRRWLHCPHCDLVFAAKKCLPAPDEEKSEYNLHQNSIDDPIYVASLQKLITPMADLLPPKAKGLDYGSGPVPVLAALLRKQGYQMEIHDPFFDSNQTPLTNIYDFVTCTEVVEHFHDPATSFATLMSLLKAQAYLGITTSLRSPQYDFLQWPYIRERSHVAFYSHKTIHWLSTNLDLKLRLAKENVIIFQT